MSNPKSPESDVAALVGELLKRHNELLYEKGLVVRRVPSDVELFLDAAIALSSKVKEAGAAPGAVARQHIVELEQCSLFVDSPPLKKAMTDAAAFLRTLLPAAALKGEAVAGDDIVARPSRNHVSDL
jgi:hypothetical protein